MENNFIFADLSTYELKTAKKFYGTVFDWNFITDDGEYHISTYGDKEVAGLYETPKKFKDMNMPSFWMSYIQVTSVEETAKRAKELGGIVELVAVDNPIGGVALIRDPLGAGFTVYEGNQLNSRFENAKNTLVWNELFVSDLTKIQPFYEGLFDWKINKESDNRHKILNSKERSIAHINVLSNDIKGKYEYWGVFFQVEDVSSIKQEVLTNNGSLIYEDDSVTALADPFGAFFHVIPMKGNTKPKKDSSPTDFKWKASLGIGLIALYFLTGWSWIWAVFFTFWVFMDVKSGHTHLFESISRRENPLLYWVIVVMWAVLGVVSLLFYPT